MRFIELDENYRLDELGTPMLGAQTTGGAQAPGSAPTTTPTTPTAGSAAPAPAGPTPQQQMALHAKQLQDQRKALQDQLKQAQVDAQTAHQRVADLQSQIAKLV